MIRVADYIIQRIYQESCHHIFMVTGRGLLYLTDAVAKHDKIAGISVHHEQAACYSAMAYAQTNETFGACLVSTGCASTNAITGVLCAYQDGIPCIVVSGQNKLKETVRHTKLPIRTYGQQEADIIGLVEPITRYAVMLEDPQDTVYEVEKALYHAHSGTKGPVWIDVPLDIQNMRIEPDQLRTFVPDTENIPTASEAEIDEVVGDLNKAARPVVLIGSGVRSSNAIDEVKQFVDDHQLPLVYSNSAPDILASGNELSIGCVGAMAANRSANFAVQNADFLLVLGARLTTMTTGADVKKFARDAKITVVDIDEFEHQKFPEMIDKVVLSDVKKFIQSLSKKKIRTTDSFWSDKCKEWKRKYPKCEERYKGDELVDLYEFSDHIGHFSSEEAIFVTDAGLEELIIPTTVSFKEGQRCLHPVSQGAMGYALPASIGAHFASARQVVAIIGDGSIMMNVQELQTIAYHRLPVKIIVINNNCYAVIRKRQNDLFRTRTIGNDPSDGVSCPDFAKLANCFGLQYQKISSSRELDRGLDQLFSADVPVLCEVMSKPDQGYIHSSYRRDKNRKFVQPPIEDQSPFLDRETFLAEMIVDPVDI